MLSLLISAFVIFRSPYKAEATQPGVALVLEGSFGQEQNRTLDFNRLRSRFEGGFQSIQCENFILS